MMALDNFVSIPGNDQVLDVLRQRLASDSAVAFTGAGTSAELYPLWPELIKKLADTALESKMIDTAGRAFWLRSAQTSPLEIGQAIKDKFGPQQYASAMRGAFAPRTTIDGRSYTKIHSALLRIPFRGFVTTNYDPGLLEARQNERPGIVDTGYSTWQDRNDVQAWLTGEIFRAGAAPILFAHGFYERPETIIFTLNDYHAAYQQRLYKRAFDKLWTQERLVIVGFSFSDPWLQHLSKVAVADTRSCNPPRHIAVIGLRSDQAYTPEMRQLFLNTYDAQVLFYPVEITDGRENHDALRVLLEDFAHPHEEPAKLRKHAQGTKFRQEWVHETTNDSRYVGRKVTLDRLDRWAADPQVQVISITGLGGLGKTALVGHWLKDRQPALRQNVVFFWSFYADRAVKPFLERFLESTRYIPRDQTARRMSPVKAAIEALCHGSIVLVLDGLEVLQEKSEHMTHGRVLENDLRELLDAMARMEHRSLVILTSRFPFVDLTPYFGSSARNLDLDRLLPGEGAELLVRSGVKGTQEQRETISRRLEGHPLALRLFAAALATQGDTDPSRLWILVFGDTSVRDDSPLWTKLDRLLAFYHQNLPPEQRTVLAFVSLFAMPIEESIVRPLINRSLARAGVVAEKGGVNGALRRLVQDGLLLQEHLAGKTQYSCHPILRDHFRSGLILTERQAAVDAADILTGRPAERRPTDVKEIIHTLNGVDLLIEAQQFRLANEIYMRRFQQGQIFMGIPAVHEGARCAIGFVGTPERRQLCRQQLGRDTLLQYLNRAGFFSAIGGEPDRSIEFFREAEAISKRSASGPNRAVALRNLAAALTQVGKLEEAEACAAEAVEIVRTNYIDRVLSAACLAEFGLILWLRGKITDSFAAFDEAEDLKASHNSLFELSSMWEVKQALALFRTGELRRARDIAETTLKVSGKRHWQQDVAACHVILGKLDLVRRDFDSARRRFDEAEAIMRRGHLLADLGGALLAQALLRVPQGELQVAERFTEEALRLASSRKLMLLRSDALCVRGQVLLRRHSTTGANANASDLDAALDAGEASLSVARVSGYLWAERDSHALLAEVWKTSNSFENANHHVQAAAALTDQLSYRRAV
jgi:tetratricopeptide (TPR) repeat protein